MQIKNLINALRVKRVYNLQSSQEITHLTNDNREVVNGSCFIAIKGETFDGHTALDDVIEKGARLLIVEDLSINPNNYPEVTIVEVASTNRAQATLANVFYGEPSTKLNVIAVTGTNGKTTISSMLSDLLEDLGHTTGKIGTLHYKVADKYYPAINTTPNSLEVQKLFSEMVESGCQDALIEASSHALVLGRLWYTDVACGIYTNLTREHLDFHKTMDRYREAKSLLFSQMGQRLSNSRSKLAVINIDDSQAEYMIEATSADIATYSLIDSAATVYADNIKTKFDHQTFDLHYKGGVHQVKLPMLGRYNVSNYLAVFLVLSLYYEFETADIIEATSHFKGVYGRMQLVDEGQPFKVILDFAHSTDALENVFRELNSQEHNRIITVMGHSGGNRDSAARPEIGDILFKNSDFVVITSDNPRSEPFDKIADELIQNHQEDHIRIEDRSEAIKYALETAQAGDIVLCAGKIGEDYQVIGDEYIPYSEEATVRKHLKSLKNN